MICYFNRFCQDAAVGEFNILNLLIVLLCAPFFKLAFRAGLSCIFRVRTFSLLNYRNFARWAYRLALALFLTGFFRCQPTIFV